MKALITGASSGIGRDIAKILSKKGYDLALVSRDEEKLQNVKKELEKNNVKIEIYAMDLSIEENCKNLHEKVKDIDIPEGKTLIDIVPDKITLENGTVVADPVGNLSSSFTISAQVILAEKNYVRQLHTIFKKAGLEIDGIVPITLAERNLILDNNELHDNIMLLDIGAGNTDIGVFEGSTFLYTNSIPLRRR